MTGYPNADMYAALYERFLQSGPQRLLDLSPIERGDMVLDLCCGSGRLGLAALDRGAEKAVLVDQCHKMIGEEAWLRSDSGSASVVVKPVDQFLRDWHLSMVVRFDKVFCQQAVNYWIDHETADRLALVMRPGGVFVFNTFGREPPTIPTWKTMAVHDEELGRDVVLAEAFYLTDDKMVHHCQMREGWEPHLTKFKWISHEQFLSMLKPNFTVDERQDGSTHLYVCTRPR